MSKLTGRLLLGIVVLFTPALAQTDHAPLPAQCIADYELWSSVLKVDREKLPVTVIQPRQWEMWQCVPVVKSERNGTAYAAEILFLYGIYSEDMNSRELAFIQRHGLMKQYVQEDAVGKR